MALPESTTVLVVGAGPAGLAAALSLHHHGCHDFVIVDAILKGQNASRAVVVHAATLEALDTIGCGDDIVSNGIKSTTFSVGTRSAKLLNPLIESLKSYTRHPYLLVITQNVTEHTLEKKLANLGIAVHRQLRVVGLKSNVENPLFSDVSFEDGRKITARYVIGADGARSAVRTTAGIGFSDPTPSEDNNLAQMAIADVTFETTNAADVATSVTLHPNGLVFFFPLPSSFNETLAADGHAPISDKVYRIACGVPLEDGEIPHAPSKEYIQNLLDRFKPYNPSPDSSANQLRIKELVWSSRFRNHASIADRTYTRLSAEGAEGGAILLIGDAAHIHSPAGGQGMNLGLRDAVSLGEALTKHIHACEAQPLSQADEILREWATTRHARALEVIKLTKTILSVAGLKYRKRMWWWCPLDSATVRAWGLWILGSVPFIQKKMAWELSGLGRR